MLIKSNKTNNMRKRILSFLVIALTVLLVGCSGPLDILNLPAGGFGRDSRKDEDTADSVDIGEQAGFSLRLTSPHNGQILKSPFLVGGEANLPDNKVFIRVKNTKDDVLITEEARIKTNPGEFGPFSALINFQFQTTDAGTVEVFGRQSGKEVGLKAIDVKFDNTAQINAVE